MDSNSWGSIFISFNLRRRMIAMTYNKPEVVAVSRGLVTIRQQTQLKPLGIFLDCNCGYDFTMLTDLFAYEADE
jgi:hypothetical protein